MRFGRNCRFALSLLLMVVNVQNTDAQHQPPQDSPALSSGTLNLILANKHGFVIAADSRRSNFQTPFNCGGRLQHYCDDSQKLFRTGSNAAVVIAGFAAGGRGTPLDLAVASVLRKRFGDKGLPDERGTVSFASEWTQHAIEQALVGVAALFEPKDLSPNKMQFWATFAGFNDAGAPVIKQLLFRGTWKPTGPLNVLAPEYDVREDVPPVQHFRAVPEGIRGVADKLLDGQYETDDPVILSYYQKRAQGVLDDLTLAEMEGLVRAILRETKRNSLSVGGEDQIGVFPAKGEVRWYLPPLPPDQQLLPRIFLKKGFLYTKDEPQGKLMGTRMSYSEGFQFPFG